MKIQFIPSTISLASYSLTFIHCVYGWAWMCVCVSYMCTWIHLWGLLNLILNQTHALSFFIYPFVHSIGLNRMTIHLIACWLECFVTKKIHLPHIFICQRTILCKKFRIVFNNGRKTSWKVGLVELWAQSDTHTFLKTTYSFIWLFAH